MVEDCQTPHDCNPSTTGRDSIGIISLIPTFKPMLIEIAGPKFKDRSSSFSNYYSTT